MKKFAVAVLIVLVASLLVSTSVFANWTGISGQLEDGKTGTSWTHGGTVFVFNCSSIGPGLELGSAAATGTGSFTVSPILNPGTTRFLCIQVVFNAGPNGTPGDYWKVLQDVAGNSGTHDAGIFYT
ncbi:MAG TPA: hypothetical protein VII92_03650, partial [Anaerolineae bacterium]